MQIDRTRFLLLTASIAGGCSPAPPVELPAQPEPPATTSELVVAQGPVDPPPAPTADAVAPRPTATQQPQVASGACDNDTGTVAACSIQGPPGPSCESLSDTKAACKSYKTGLRGAIAAKAVACLNKVSGTADICDYTKSESCATEAIRSACVQPSTFNACSGVMATCGGMSWSKLSMQDCQQLLSATKDGKRKAMISCMTEGCSIESCTWQLR
jgi:hypothetical protein